MLYKISFYNILKILTKNNSIIILIILNNFNIKLFINFIYFLNLIKQLTIKLKKS